MCEEGDSKSAVLDFYVAVKHPNGDVLYDSGAQGEV